MADGVFRWLTMVYFLRPDLQGVTTRTEPEVKRCCKGNDGEGDRVMDDRLEGGGCLLGSVSHRARELIKMSVFRFYGTFRSTTSRTTNQRSSGTLPCWDGMAVILFSLLNECSTNLISSTVCHVGVILILSLPSPCKISLAICTRENLPLPPSSSSLVVPPAPILLHLCSKEWINDKKQPERASKQAEYPSSSRAGSQPV